MSIYISQFSMTVWAPVGDEPPPMEPPITRTMRFGAGTTGNSWYLVASVSDSGHELRSKVIKAVRAIGKFTDAALQIYTWDLTQNINVSDLEAGTNSTTGDIALTDTTGVQQTPRFQLNAPNAVLSTVRIEGTWDGVSPADQVHELEYEVAIQGARR